MASVLALISKTVFSKLLGHPVRYRLGDVIPLDRYTSKHAAFDQLADGDSIFLVTVRPKGLLVVAILDHPKRRGEALVGATNTTPLAFITDQLPAIRLADGKGITATLDKLGMSLQTPRVLADEDVVLLRGDSKTAERPPKQGTRAKAKPALVTAAPVKMKLPPKPARGSAKTPKLTTGELGSRARELVEKVYATPGDRSLRAVLADQLLEDQHIWGELISLQLGDPKRHAARIDHLVRQHARMIVGAIANVASRDDLTITDGFLSAATCGKSSSFTSGPERHEAAIAPQWATAETVIFTSRMTGTFIRELLHNPASSNLTKIAEGHPWDRRRRATVLERGKPGDPWQLVGAYCARVLDGLPDAELARIPTPSKQDLRAALEAARQRREKARAKPATKARAKVRPGARAKRR